ncbi:hypothetical protein [Phyllobacterium calauticae]|jgi:hypothetical protein|uniref:hypothetical protein n=1 Tax=Phyllobacterium calauticae TaxID=2817027 RepID=UPI001CBD153A|nr:hypothetical protein [Phyllobacterium calauticae]MBZ3691030.1 hypothetical protein [Phyllobacterium calauticae]
MTSIPLHAPYEVRRSKVLAAIYDRTHLRLKLEVAQMETELGQIVERAVKRAQRVN